MSTVTDNPVNMSEENNFFFISDRKNTHLCCTSDTFNNMSEENNAKQNQDVIASLVFQPVQL